MGRKNGVEKSTSSNATDCIKVFNYKKEWSRISINNDKKDQTFIIPETKYGIGKVFKTVILTYLTHKQVATPITISNYSSMKYND